MSDFLLAGVRVIDAASFIAGPVATTIMADLGADVIKIEPPDGDPYRNRTGGPGVAESPYNYRWIIDNRTKRGLALDLRQPAGRAVVHRLVERADVFVTNTPLESRTRLGIRWSDLAPLNPRLVYASMTAYGERGDEAPRTGFDATALWARTGLMDLVKPSPGLAPRALAAGDGRSSDRRQPVRGDHDRALSARSDRPRHDGVDLAPGQWPLVERDPDPGRALRRARRAAAAARGAGDARSPTSIAAPTTAGSS